jgi:hypothetical protein
MNDIVGFSSMESLVNEFKQLASTKALNYEGIKKALAESPILGHTDGSVMYLLKMQIDEPVPSRYSKLVRHDPDAIYWGKVDHINKTKDLGMALGRGGLEIFEKDFCQARDEYFLKKECGCRWVRPSNEFKSAICNSLRNDVRQAYEKALC